MPRPKLDASVLLLLALSVALALFHYSYTPVLLRNPDASQHLAYIQFLLDRHALPRATDCSVCHHPPLYYLAAAALAQVCRALGTAPERTLQLASLTLMFAVNVLYAYVNTALFPRPAQRAWATALVAFWPLGIIASARVNNDVGFYAFAARVFFCLVRWWRRPQARWLGIAAAAVALGALGANAMVLHRPRPRPRRLSRLPASLAPRADVHRRRARTAARRLGALGAPRGQVRGYLRASAAPTSRHRVSSMLAARATTSRSIR
ncbi:MAG: glycosyltransferase family 39 protein [Polyangiaceae bacterium]